jgi:hypothetical protein
MKNYEFSIPRDLLQSNGSLFQLWDLNRQLAEPVLITRREPKFFGSSRDVLSVMCNDDDVPLAVPLQGIYLCRSYTKPVELTAHFQTPKYSQVPPE